MNNKYWIRVLWYDNIIQFNHRQIFTLGNIWDSSWIVVCINWRLWTKEVNPVLWAKGYLEGSLPGIRYRTHILIVIFPWFISCFYSHYVFLLLFRFAGFRCDVAWMKGNLGKPPRLHFGIDSSGAWFAGCTFGNRNGLHFEIHNREVMHCCMSSIISYCFKWLLVYHWMMYVQYL